MKIFPSLIVPLILLATVPKNGSGQVEPLHTYQQKKHFPVCTAYSSDGNYLATGGTDNNILIWSLSNQILYKRLTGAKDLPLVVAFDQENRLVLSGGKDKLISIWNLASTTRVMVLEGHQGNVLSLALSPDNRYIASGSMDNTIRIWDRTSGTTLRILKGHQNQVNSVAYSYDGTKLLSASADRTIKEWDAQSGQVLRTLSNGHTDWIRKAGYSPDGKYIVSCGDDRCINIWDRKSGQVVNTIMAHKDHVYTFSFSPDGRYLVSGGHDKRLVVTELETGRIVFQSPLQKNFILAANFSPDGTSFTSTVLYSDEIQLWDTRQLNITKDSITRSVAQRQPQQRAILPPGITSRFPSDSVSRTDKSILPVVLELRTESGIQELHVTLNGKVFATYHTADLEYTPPEKYVLKRNLFLTPGINTICYNVLTNDGGTSNLKQKVLFSPVKQPELVWDKDLQAPVQTSDPVFEIRSTVSSLTTLKSVLLYNNDQLVLTKNQVYLNPDTGHVHFNSLITLQEGLNELKLVAGNEGGVGESSLLAITYTPPKKEIEIIIPPAKPNPYRFALIIGNEDYSSYQVGLESEANVAYAKNDAIEFRNYAIKYLGVPEEQAILKLNARYIEMKREIKKLQGIMEVTHGKAEFFFYYAGHGFPHEKTKEPYLIPVDGSGTDLEFSAISLNELYTELTTYPSARVTVFLDACFSGGGRNKGIDEARGVKIKPQSANMRNNLVVFSAASETQTSMPYNDMEHGIFTYYVLKKIEETGGFVSYKELSDYVTEQVGIKSYLINSKKQVPEVHASPDITSEWQNWRLR